MSVPDSRVEAAAKAIAEVAVGPGPMESEWRLRVSPIGLAKRVLSALDEQFSLGSADAVEGDRHRSWPACERGSIDMHGRDVSSREVVVAKMLATHSRNGSVYDGPYNIEEWYECARVVLAALDEHDRTSFVDPETGYSLAELKDELALARSGGGVEPSREDRSDLDIPFRRDEPDREMVRELGDRPAERAILTLQEDVDTLAEDKRELEARVVELTAALREADVSYAATLLEDVGTDEYVNQPTADAMQQAAVKLRALAAAGEGEDRPERATCPKCGSLGTGIRSTAEGMALICQPCGHEWFHHFGLPADIEILRAHARREHDGAPLAGCRVCRKFGSGSRLPEQETCMALACTLPRWHDGPHSGPGRPVPSQPKGEG